MRRVQRVVAIAVLGLAVGVSPAVAFQGPWVLPAADLSPASSTQPQVAVAPDGTTTVVWTQATSDRLTAKVQARTRPPGGTFGAPVDVSAPGESVGSPQVAVAPDGTTTVVYLRGIDAFGMNLVRVSTRPPGGTFGDQITLSEVDNNLTPRVAVAPDGTATVVWSADGVVTARTRPPGGTFSAPVTVGSGWWTALAVTPAGAVTAVWEHFDGTHRIVQASSRPPGGGFGVQVDVSAADANAITPQVAVAPDGTTTVAWFSSDGSIVQASTRPPGGTFSAPVDLGGSVDPNENQAGPKLAVAPDGTTTVVYARVFDYLKHTVRAITRAPGGTFGAPVDVSDPGPSTFDPDVAVSADGTVTVAWTRVGAVQTSTRPPGGTFSSPLDLFSVPEQWGFPVRLAVAPDGAATAVWTRNRDTDSFVQATFTIDGPPVLRAAPVISGGAALGVRLGCDGGSWAGATSVTRGWLRGASPIGDGPGYTTTSADQGAALSCRARASNVFGSVESLSLPLSIPAASTPPVARSLPKITGRARLGRTLRCRAATFTAATTRTISWLRASKPIKGARRTTYKITKRDLGQIISCRTTAKGPGGTSTVISLGTRARR